MKLWNISNIDCQSSKHYLWCSKRRIRFSHGVQEFRLTYAVQVGLSCQSIGVQNTYGGLTAASLKFGSFSLRKFLAALSTLVLEAIYASFSVLTSSHLIGFHVSFYGHGPICLMLTNEDVITTFFTWGANSVIAQRIFKVPSKAGTK